MTSERPPTEPAPESGRTLTVRPGDTLTLLIGPAGRHVFTVTDPAGATRGGGVLSDLEFTTVVLRLPGDPKPPPEPEPLADRVARALAGRGVTVVTDDGTVIPPQAAAPTEPETTAEE